MTLTLLLVSKKTTNRDIYNIRRTIRIWTIVSSVGIHVNIIVYSRVLLQLVVLLTRRPLKMSRRTFRIHGLPNHVHFVVGNGIREQTSCAFPLSRLREKYKRKKNNVDNIVVKQISDMLYKSPILCGHVLLLQQRIVFQIRRL